MELSLAVVPRISDKVKSIREHLRATQDRQKSYVDKERRPMEFQVGGRVILKVSPLKGIIRFENRGKLSPRLLGPFAILDDMGLQAYKLDLLPEMSRIHNIFHVCYLRKCLVDEDAVSPSFRLRSDFEGEIFSKEGRIVTPRSFFK
ncbi:hypothetical protein L6452_22448 [Arctium lappa]|uniref:Uncharacterized protein n=1 Tax=Arctium lappa TaxID=4217 RepID=A0ACB9B460_ARCLA|nr:hypothetical protein L6452_22448 [Arctium lappa]